jgi:hypothetical protein
MAGELFSRILPVRLPGSIGQVQLAGGAAQRLLAAAVVAGGGGRAGVSALATQRELSHGSGQLDLNVVGIPEGQDRNLKSGQILDLSVRYTLLPEEARCTFKIIATADGKADVVKSDPILVKSIIFERTIRGRPQGYEHGAVAEKDLWLNSSHLLQAHYFRVELT